MIAPANKKIKDLEQLATLKNNDRSSQKAEIHSVLRDSNIYHGWNSNQNAFSFDFTKVFFFEKRCWSARFYAPQSSVLSLSEKFMLS